MWLNRDFGGAGNVSGLDSFVFLGESSFFCWIGKGYGAFFVFRLLYLGVLWGLEFKRWL